jgi:hypothetical protein
VCGSESDKPAKSIPSISTSPDIGWSRGVGIFWVVHIRMKGVGGGGGRVGIVWIGVAVVWVGICWLGELGVHRYGMGVVEGVREVFVVCMGVNIGMKGVGGGMVWIGVSVVWVGLSWAVAIGMAGSVEEGVREVVFVV